MVRSPKPPSQTWRAFLDNHLSQLASVDFFTIYTVWFEILFVFIVLAHDRRRVVHFNVTAHPTAEWTAQQMLEAFPFDTAPIRSYFSYYHRSRLHLSLDRDSPDSRSVQSVGRVIAFAEVGGLHHRYERVA
jgi:hypothetical protein